MATFTLTITLGNDAMRDAYDVAVALVRLGEHIADHQEFDSPRSDPIIDADGNRVGEWRVSA